jgi:hypothetical protein
MKKLMKMMLMLALAASVTGALAWDVPIAGTYIAGTNLMILPPVVAASEQWQQYPVRATSVVVNAGARYRIGTQVIIAAHAGTMTNTAVTTTTYYTNGVQVALAGAQYAATNGIAVYTNTVIAVAPITVPAAGISGYDGSVRWYRARTADQDDVKIQIDTTNTVVLVDGAGNSIRYTATVDKDFPDFGGALYFNALTTTNGVDAIRVMPW